MPRLALTRSFSPLSRRCAVPLLLGQTNVSSRTLSSYASSFVDLACSSASKHQLYLSSCDDPFVNLSIEHYLLEKSPPDSIVLLFYVNRPCIVIGRNQNPWLEVNLSLLRQNDIQQPIALVRRRSGGGTVFHDYGNVNVSLIRPPSAFTRNALLEIIVHAIRPREPRVTINERHDIVLQPFAGEDGVTRKVSGSAYKLTRHRALHHATCLVDSPNLERISAFLRSSGRGYIKARGVDSVRSPVGNLFPGSGDQGVNAFIRQVTDAFAQERHLGDGWREQLVNRSDKVFLDSSAGVVYGVLGEELAEVDRIKDGIEQLKNPAWLYGQTPQFTFETHPNELVPVQRPLLPEGAPSNEILQWNLSFTARAGIVTQGSLKFSPLDQPENDNLPDHGSVLEGTKLYELRSWTDPLGLAKRLSGSSEDAALAIDRLSVRLDKVFGLRSS